MPLYSSSSNEMPLFDVNQNQQQYPLITSLADTDTLLVKTAIDGAYKSISVLDFKTILGSGDNVSITPVNLTYASDGDTNGLFYYAGTLGGKAAWQNPAAINQIVISMSSAYSSQNNDATQLTNRQPSSAIATSDTPGSFYQIYINYYAITPNYYSLRARDYPANNPTGWIIKASVDGSTWDTLDTVSNLPLAQNQWISRALTGVTKSYRFFQIVENGLSSSGDNIFCIGEFEVYGIATPV